MAKQIRVYDGTQWVDLAQSVTDLSNYANLTTTPISGFRNAIINGDFKINQRAFTSTSSNSTFTLDRWSTEFSGVTTTYSAPTFSAGIASTLGYEATNHMRIVTSSAGAGSYALILQRIEDVRSFAGQTVTMSFWAKASSGTPKVGVRFAQVFGTGGSTFVGTNAPTSQTISTSWNRYSFTVSVPSISGKTIGANSFLAASILVNDDLLGTGVGIQNNTFDIWGVQVEKGTVATPFEQRPIGTELALCQRYYQILPFFGYAVNTGEMGTSGIFKVTMRTTPSMGAALNSGLTGGGGNSLTRLGVGQFPVGSATAGQISNNAITAILCSGLTAGAAYSGSVDISAEL